MKYRVTIPYAVFVTTIVEADNPEDAEELAFDESSIHSFCGNGGTDKLIGVTGADTSIEANDCSLEDGGYEITVEEL